ncbi:single-stranded DNA-binding protein [Salinibacterium sp. UTAS2018]|uniref:single-stranded DNA-binding protein n=1 Tax=Salinibacterium sp. UTAS2018 TaxID=2508880 RepID=UPI0010093D22|nr:single-stranded DNA-binding protein [Salinibacterium sp. UTAS2018]QAV69766.1 single-stranded DNA-binding protein [Salinibacterium sp. UTAS2018]
MSDTITVSGLVATVPRHIVTGEGLPITSFRLASTQRRFDRSNQRWIDGETNWYTITSFRQLAINSATSIGKGDRVVLTGRLKIREWENADRSGTNIEIEADALGHDLMWGTAQFSRTISSVNHTTSDSADDDEFPASDNADSDDSSEEGELVAASSGAEKPF